ncbi:chorismate mutase [Oceanobacillus senegalensis]|uniref:chorismate mutase n=1 Tax=Oceanobacillus senegalensis TaxID=1936063 RepID=UPI000A30ED6F|nr:chorismate mutase [Oceanobacillus senegalensis]
MTRGIRGATTVTHNDEKEILKQAKDLIVEMIDMNNVQATDVSHVFISVTKDLNATFPAKALREIDGWKYVPVMCMAEIDVPHGLKQCIRVMMVTNTNKSQEEIKHIFKNEAVKLRPDLVKGD